MPENPREIVARYKKMGAHLLNEPQDFSAVEKGPFEFVFNEVLLNTQGPFPNGHIYEGTKGYGDRPTKYRLSGAALEELGRCVNISWSLSENKIVLKDDDSVIAQAVGGLRLPDGSMAVSAPQKCEVSLFAKREELRLLKIRNRKSDNRTKKLDDTQFDAWMVRYLDEEIAKERKFRVAKAESGAKNRVIRKMLPLKGEYTLAELKKPFVGVQVSLVPNYSDPKVQDQLHHVFVASVAGSFGLPLAAPAEVPLPVNQVTGHVIDPAPDAPEPASEPAPGGDNGLSIEEMIQIEVTHYREAPSRDDRLKWIDTLMGETVYDRAKLTKPIADYEDAKLEEFFKKLIERKLAGGA